MSKILALVFASLLVFSGSALAQTHAAHEHGVATLDVAIESGGFDVDLHGPLANFISFEHEPSTDAQKAEVADMVTKLAKADELFKSPTAAGCKVKSIALASEKIPAELFGQYAAKEGEGHGHGHDHGDEADHDHEGEHDHGDEADHYHGDEADHDHGDEADHDHEGEGAEHGDLDAEFVFECSGAVTSLDIGLFSVFPAILEVEARVVSAAGQTAAELTADKAKLSW